MLMSFTFGHIMNTPVLDYDLGLLIICFPDI